MRNPISSFNGEFELTNVTRLVIERLGHAFDTRLVSPKELDQANLLGDQVARHSHYGSVRTERSDKAA